MQLQHRGARLMMVALLLVPIALMQMRVDHKREAVGLSGGGTQFIKGSIDLPSNMLGAALAGFREPVAGLLWVKSDDLFHTGKFEEVVPLMKIITLLDPHMIDVYATGSWHLDYNFVDKNERSDRRLIPSAIDFLKEGIKNNPNIYDLYFELAFTHYMIKIKEPQESIPWLLMALGKKTSDGDPTPRFVNHTLAHAYEMSGQIDKCLAVWKKCRDSSKAEVDKYIRAGKLNPDGTAKRQSTVGANAPAETAAWEYDVASRNYDRVLTKRMLRADLSSRRLQCDLKCTISKDRPRSMTLQGTINAPDYTKLDVILRDIDWQDRAKRDFVWRLDNQTIFQDQVSVTAGKFKTDIDLTDGARFYPLKSDRYELLVVLNPRNQPAESQDRVGWSGEGLDDKRFLDTSVPGLRKIQARLIVPIGKIL